MDVAIVLAVLKSRWTDAAKFTNVGIAGFGQSRHLIAKKQVLIKDETDIAGRVVVSIVSRILLEICCKIHKHNKMSNG